MAGAIAGKQGMAKPVAGEPEWKRLLPQQGREKVLEVFQDERIAPILETIKNYAPRIHAGLQKRVLEETHFVGFPGEVFDDLVGKGKKQVMMSELTGALDERVLGVLRQPEVRDGLVDAMHESGMAKGTAEVVVDEFLKTGVMAQHVYARAYPRAENAESGPVDRFIEKRDDRATEALMRAVLEQVPWVPYEGRQVTVKELAQLAYFGSEMKKELVLEYLAPNDFMKMWEPVYKDMVDAKMLDPKKVTWDAFIARRSRATMTEIGHYEDGKEVGSSVVVNGAYEGLMTVSYVLATYIHETAHARIPLLEGVRTSLHDVISEGIAEDVSRVGLEGLGRAFPNVPFEACGMISGHHTTDSVYVFGRMFAQTLREMAGMELYQKLIVPGLQLVATEGGEREMVDFLKLAEERIGAEMRR